MPERRVALITGAAKRVGRAFALALATDGYDIAFTYLSSHTDADKLSADLAALGAASLAIRADLTQPTDAVNKIGRAVIERFDRLNVLVHNASLFEPGRLESASAAQVAKLMAIHVTSPLLLTQRFATHLRASRGHVVTMVDHLAEKPWPEYTAYCASKAALMNITLSLSRSLAPDVTVNGIAPGVIEWPEDMPQSERDKYLKRVPLARAGTPGDAANLLRFLVRDGSYVTGQIIRLDGGRSIM